MSDSNQKITNKIIKLLNDQRKNAKYCDLIIKLNNDYQVYSHYCVIAPQSDFVGNSYFLQNNLKFSINNPLIIEIQNFDCYYCLELMFDFLYSNDIILSQEHEEHFQSLSKKLGVADILQIFEKTAEKVDGTEQTTHLLNKPRKKNIKVSYVTSSKSTQSKMHYCSGCDFKCYKPSVMITHSQNCAVTLTKCSLCDAQFESKIILQEHLVRHSDSKPFFCKDCDQRFVTKAALSLHIPKHSSETPFICSHCGKGFKWKHGLNNHLIVHSNEKKLLCDECGYSTAHLQTFRAHKLSHNGNLWKCSVNGCSHTTRRKENLKIHMATHRKETPFVCEICGHRFSQIKNLKRHALLHISKNIYKCTYCSFGSYRSDKLREHQARQHSGKPVVVEL